MKFDQLETWIESVLGLPLSFCSKSSTLNGCRDAKDVTKLVLADSMLETLPMDLGEFTGLTELDLSDNPLAESCGLIISSLIKGLPALTSIK